MTKQTSSGMPQITSAFGGWMTKITFLKHTETVVNGFVKINQIPISFQGTVQPLSARALALKPEGQRSWQWLRVHCLSSVQSLIPGDRLTWNGGIYKVEGIFDYSLNGYMEYEICKDYQTTGGPGPILS